MGHCHYNEKWREHNSPAAASEPEPVNLSVFPDWFDVSMFEETQLEYLAQYEIERRGDLLKKILDFLTSDRENRIERICVLDKLINRTNLTWREAPAFYAVSNHKFFEAKNELEHFFSNKESRVLNMLKVRETRSVVRESNNNNNGQMFLNL